MTKPHRYREGDWFAAPLGDGTYVLGRIARHSKGIIFGYFFAPPFDHAPTLEEAAGRRAEESFTQFLFSHLGLRDGTWSVLGQTGDWNGARGRCPSSSRSNRPLDDQTSCMPSASMRTT